MRKWANGLLVSLAACVLWTAAGCQVHMPNTGIISGEYTDIVELPPAVEPRAAFLSSGLLDQVGGYIAKLVAAYVDKQLIRLREKYEGVYGCEIQHEGPIARKEGGRSNSWVFVRGVRFPMETDLDDESFVEPGFSGDVISFFDEVRKDYESWKVNPTTYKPKYRRYAPGADKKRESLESGWFLDEDLDKDADDDTEKNPYLQFVAVRIIWNTEPGQKDPRAFLIKNVRIEVFASKALMPGWDKLKKAIEDMADQEARKAGVKDISGVIAKYATKKLVDELSLSLTATVGFSFLDEQGKHADGGEVTFAVKGIWPADTKLVAGKLVPGFSRDLGAFQSRWMPNAGTHYNVRGQVFETSRYAEWVEEVRKLIKKELEELQKGG